MRKRSWQVAIVGALVTTIGMAIVYRFPLCGLLRREQFFEGMPTSYWKEVLRHEGSTLPPSYSLPSIDASESWLPILRGPTNKAVDLSRPGALPVLRELVRDEDPRIGDLAAVILSSFGRPAVPLLIELLDECDSHLRLRAITALRIVGPDAEEAIAVLALSMRSDRELAYNSAEALAAIGPAAVPELIRALNDDNLSTKFRAVFALKHMGTRASDAIPFLNELAKASDVDLASEAAEALKLIECERP